MSDRRTPFIPPQAATLLRAGRKIEAIKLVLDANPGLGLRQAKDAVEHYQRQPSESEHAHSASSEATPPPSGGLPAQAELALRRGNKIEAIKRVLDANPGLGLRQAKEAVERYERQSPNAAHAPPTPAEAAASDGFPAQAELALRSGNKIEAVKIVRALYKLDLHEALARVDAHLQGQAADAPGAGSAGRTELPADVAMALMRGDRVGALELLEKTHGLSNADAIQRVLQYERQRGKRGLSGRVDGTVRPGDSNAGMLWWALLIAGAAAVAWYVLGS
ncbi:hypothetical protein [Lysobacter sp. 1R34A]|uniref:hypothetical protein n=1 Tax=Lysobacter sp. 1R34A TaxID=3445786 RepID=UPI003EEC58A2